jgi:hypothetical protein
MIFLLSLAFATPPEYTYLEKGMEAPFSGRLFNDSASQLIADELANCVEKCQIEMDYQIGLALAKKEEEISKLKSQHKFDKQVLNSKIEQQQLRIKELEQLKTPPKRQLWFTLGLISGVGITISIAKAVN